MSTPIITERELRLFAKDFKDSNDLLGAVRFSPEEIEQAVINVIDYFNILPPPTGITYAQEAFPSKALLAKGVWGWLLMGASIHQASNELEYAADGVTINDDNKAQIFTAIGQKFWDEFVTLAKDIKLTQNINQVYGTKNSEYRYRFF